MTRVTEVLAGRYELVEVLGRGGMGVVYAATDRSLSRRVAVKVLPVDRAADPTLVARFQREALAAAALSHRNIVAVYDTGQDEDTHYIVMEYVRGQSLSELVHARGSLPAAEAAEIAAQIASALAAAHEAGIVHRDIKPANAMVDTHGLVKVLDFGIARVASSTTLTHTSMVLGSAPYIAPEVAQGHPADARSDIYSLGCVLYELLCGRAPFTGELAAAVLHQHSTATPQPLTALSPGVPAELDALVMQMLAKAPDARPQRAEELIPRLAGATGAAGATLGPTQPLPTRPVPTPDATVPLPPRQPPDATAPMRTQRLRSDAPDTAITRFLPPPPGRHLPRMLAAAALMLALAAILVIALASGNGPGKHPAQAAHRTATRPAGRSGTSTSTGSTTPTTASSSTTTPSLSTTTPTTSTTSAPPTLAVAAGSLANLLSQAAQTGGIDQQASQQISQQLQNVLAQYQQGHTDNALKQLPKLQQQIAQLAGHGDISATTATQLNSAVSTLGAALASAVAVPGDNGPGQDQQGPGPGGPPGHGHDH